jgi:hypothetical protein
VAARHVRPAARYLFLNPRRPWAGHNLLAAAGMFFMYVIGTVFMIVTGFALYGEGLGQESWIFTAFSSWVLRSWARARTSTRCTTRACGTCSASCSCTRTWWCARTSCRRDRHQHDGQRLAVAKR